MTTTPAAEPYVANTSGDRSRAIPLQAQGGSWGAFVFGGLWALCNGVWFGALSFLTLLAPLTLDSFPRLSWLAMSIGFLVWGYLTVSGRHLAWTHKRWASYQQFRDTQRAWSVAAKVVFGVSLIPVVFMAGLWMLLGQGLSHMNG